MSRSIRRLAWCFLAHLVGVLTFGADESPTELFAHLRDLPQKEGFGFSAYYDMHGNPNDELRALAIGRFRFTAAICAEVNAMNSRDHPEYVAALYGVLARVCDPKSIPWLEQRLAGTHRNEVYSDWLPAFGTSEKWLTGPDEWSAFFERWVSGETRQQYRTRIFQTMTLLQCPRTLNFFSGKERDSATQGEDLLIARGYLEEHGEKPADGRLKEIIDQIGGSASGKKSSYGMLAHW